MKPISTLLTILSLFLFTPVFAQQPTISHNFKIQGLTEIPNLTSFASTKMVEYDPQSPDHLLVSFFDSNEKIVSKTRFLFKKKKFELAKAGDYLVANDLVLDGPHVSFFNDGNVDKELIYKNGILQQETSFYSGGTKKSIICGDEQTKNGAFKMWHPNSHPWFSGEYSNNLKNGEFQQFDELGKLIRRGEYQQGKLISGDPVVPDIFYKNPEIKAEYSEGNLALNNELNARFDTLKRNGGIFVQNALRKNVGIYNHMEKLNLSINKSGRVIQVQKVSGNDPVFFSISRGLLTGLTGFTPAREENVPVDSELILEFQLSPQRFAVITEELPLSLNQENEVTVENTLNRFTVVDQLSDNKDENLIRTFDYEANNVDQKPDYPGGIFAMRKFIAMTVRYPVEAQENGIVGKVFVSFVINEKGDISNIRIAKGVHPLLDQEAIRAVSQMGRWKPGVHDGKPVRVSYTIPITFDIKVSNYPE